jgi:CBS domain-containing protein
MAVPISTRFFGDTVTLDARMTVQDFLDEQSPEFIDADGVKVIVAHEGNTVTEAIRLFQQRDLHHLPVVAEGGEHVVGIVSSTDVLNMFLESSVIDPGSVKVSQIMTPEPEVVLRATPFQIAIAILANSKFRCLPVVTEEGAIYGILTTRDVVRFLNQAFKAR